MSYGKWKNNDDNKCEITLPENCKKYSLRNLERLLKEKKREERQEHAIRTQENLKKQKYQESIKKVQKQYKQEEEKKIEEEKIARLTRKSSGSLPSQIQQIESQLQILKIQNEELQEKNKTLENNNQKYIQQINEFFESNQTLASQLNNAKEHLNTYEGLVTRLENENNSKNDRINDLLKKLREKTIQREKSESTADISELQELIKENQSKLNAKDREINKLKNEYEVNVESLNEQLISSTKKNGALLKQITGLLKDKENSDNVNVALQREIDQIKPLADQYQISNLRISELETKLDDYERTIQEMEETIRELEDYNEYYEGIASFLTNPTYKERIKNYIDQGGPLPKQNRPQRVKKEQSK